MRKLALAVTIVLISSAAFAQRGLRFEDLVSLHRIGAPQLSPNGHWLAYDVSTPDLAANKSFSGVYLVPSIGGTPKLISDGARRLRIRSVGTLAVRPHERHVASHRAGVR